MKQYIYVILFCLTTSCVGDKSNEVLLPMSAINDAIRTKIDTIVGADQFMYAKKFYVYRDSLLIVLNKATDTVHFVDLVDIHSGVVQKSLFLKGRSQQEVIDVETFLQHNYLIMDDYVASKVAFVELDSLMQDEGYKPKFFKYNFFAQSLNRYSDSLLICENPYCFEDRKFNIKNDAQRLVIVDANATASVFGEHKFYTHNVSVGAIFTNLPKNRIVYASRRFPIIEIYDTSFNLKKAIRNAEELEVNYVIEPSNNEVVFKGVIPYTYISSFCDDEGFYLGYVGDYLTTDASILKMNTTILKFDWDGNFIESYLVGQYISTLSKGKEDKVFYGTAYTDDMVPILIKIDGSHGGKVNQ